VKAKDLVKDLLPPLLLRRLRAVKYRHQRYFGLGDLDRKLEKYLDIDGGYFVELGANDGITNSNTFRFERNRNWRGTLIEPIPHKYLQCRANRPVSKVFCNACTSFEYAEKFVPIAYANLLSTPIGLESDISDPLAHAKKGQYELDPDDTFVFGALARPLNSILIDSGAPLRIDLLSLDVEGAEMEVLKGIDHEQFRFRFMCIECRSKDRLIEFLGAQRYRLIDQLSHHDYLFKAI
jgi:FkbM family methyltransferase